MKSVAFVVLFSLVLGACAIAPATPPLLDVKTVQVNVPTPVACIDQVPAAPAVLSDQDLLAGSGEQVADKLWTDHLQNRDYIAKLLAVISPCVTVAGTVSTPSKLGAAPLK